MNSLHQNKLLVSGNLDIPIDVLDLSPAREQWLREDGVYTIRQLVNRTADDLFNRRLSFRSLKEIRIALDNHGLKLKGD